MVQKLFKLLQQIATHAVSLIKKYKAITLLENQIKINPQSLLN